MFAYFKQGIYDIIKKSGQLYTMGVIISVPHTIDHLRSSKHTYKEKIKYIIKGVFLTPFYIVSSNYYESLNKLLPKNI